MSEDSTKKRQLKKHKAIATGLFFLMAVIYVLMIYLQHHQSETWMGYVEAFAEAGMVGALADWFAVTALFKHPLGLPIPHTNIIQRKKDDLGVSLGHFVNENFLNPQNIRPYIERIDAAKIGRDWLNKSKNTAILETEILNLIAKIISELDDDEVEEFLTSKSTALLHQIDFPQIVSSGLNYLVKNNEHIQLLENLLPEIRIYIQNNEKLILNRIAANRPFIAFLAGKKISSEITHGFVQFIKEIEADENHFVRKKLSETLLKFAEDLKTTDQWETKFTALKNDFITSKNLQPYIQDIWQNIKMNLLEDLVNPKSKLKYYLHQNIQKLAVNLRKNETLKNRLNNWVQHFAYRMVLKNRQEVEELIHKTVNEWEGKELSKKLELEVGKDLQFIRVNGTLVGGLVGLIIYTVTQFFV